MTIRISLRVVAFVVYTLALLGGAFGISYGVFEWRHDEEAAATIPAPVQSGPSQAELDAQRCEAALEALGVAASTERFRLIPQDLEDAIDRYCK